MNHSTHSLFNRWQSANAFTLTEIMVASAIAVSAIAVSTATFLWSVEQSTLCTKIAWSETEGMNSSEKITGLLRNAAKVKSIDTSGNWVELQFPDNSTAKLIHSNALTSLRDGKMYIQRTNQTQLLIVRGLTPTMDNQGFNLPVFTMAGSNTVRVAFRLSEPTAQGVKAADDGDFAASFQFSVFLRNSPRTQ